MAESYATIRKRMQRAPAITAIELKNNRYAFDEWQDSKKLYCLLHCRVYEDFDEYIAEVEKELAAL